MSSLSISTSSTVAGAVFLVASLFPSLNCVVEPALAQQIQLPVGQQADSKYGQQTLTSRAHVLGRDDELQIWAAEIPDLAVNGGRSMTIDSTGHINMPLVGEVEAEGKTVSQLETDLIAALRVYIKQPQVNVTLREIRSQPVSVIGAVNAPGVHQLRGRKTLLEIVSMAGGLRNDAGYAVTITRRAEQGALELPNATLDAKGTYWVADVNLENVMNGSNPEQNVIIQPNDVVSVSRAKMVYVVGEVSRAGGFVLNEQESLSVLRALSLAGGLTSMAAPGNARIIRGGIEDIASNQEIAVDLKRILGGKEQDVPLQADDVLFIPDSTSKKLAVRSAEAILQTLTGILVFRAGR